MLLLQQRMLLLLLQRLCQELKRTLFLAWPRNCFDSCVYQTLTYSCIPQTGGYMKCFFCCVSLIHCLVNKYRSVEAIAPASNLHVSSSSLAGVAGSYNTTDPLLEAHKLQHSSDDYSKVAQHGLLQHFASNCRKQIPQLRRRGCMHSGLSSPLLIVRRRSLTLRLVQANMRQLLGQARKYLFLGTYH